MSWINRLCLLWLLLSRAVFAGEPLQVTVVEPFVDIRTGPGKAYPVHYVAERGATLHVIKSRVRWYKVSLQANGGRVKTGWVHIEHLGKTTVAGSEQPAATDSRLGYIFDSPWSTGFMLGNLGDADLLTAYFGFAVTDQFTAELHASQYFGLNQEGWLANGLLKYSFFPRWWATPYVQLGFGRVNQQFKGLLQLRDDTEDNFLQSGGGITVSIGQRYSLRFEYRQLNVLTSREDNEELELWQVGFAANL